MTRIASLVVALMFAACVACTAATGVGDDDRDGERERDGDGDDDDGDGEGDGDGDGDEGEGDRGGEGEGDGHGEGEGEGEGEGDGDGDGEGEGEGDDGDDGYGLYDGDGPITFTSFSVDVHRGDGSAFTVHVTLPDVDDAPVVIFGPGTQQPMSSYVAFRDRWASWGIASVGRNDPGPLGRTPALVDDLALIVSEWLPAQVADSNSALFGKIDLARVGLAGHSRGGKATLLAAEGPLHDDVSGYFGVDTIDATFIDDGVYAVTEMADVSIPTVFLVASIPGACSPESANGETLYAQAPSPSTMITALGAGHTQFATPCVGCTLACSPAGGDVDDAIVLDYSVRYSTAFFARVLLDDTSVGIALEEGAGVSLDEAAGLVTIERK